MQNFFFLIMESTWKARQNLPAMTGKFLLRLTTKTQLCYTRRFATTILWVTQRCNIGTML